MGTMPAMTEAELILNTVKAMDEGYAGFLPGGVVVDVRKFPKARPAPGPDGRNAAEYIRKHIA